MNRTLSPENTRDFERRAGWSILSALLLLLCVLIGSPCGACGAVVREVHVTGLRSIGEGELLELLGIVPGAPIDRERVRRGIQRAFLKGIFEDIVVEAPDGEATSVLVRVRERPRVQNISLDGSYALSKKTILSLFPLKKDQYLTCTMLDRAVKTLESEIASRGYPHVRIQVKTEEMKRRNRLAVRLTVDTGDPQKIEKLVVRGTTDKIASVMRLSEGDVFDRSALERDMERIRAYYRKRQYLRPVVEIESFKDCVLTLAVTPGRRLVIAFDGNAVLSEKALLGAVPFFDAEDFNDDLVEESIQRMLSLYRANGYPFAQIAPVFQQKAETIHLTYFVFEGKRVRTGSISLVGTHLDEKKLKSMLSLAEGRPFNPDLMDADRETLVNFFTALGYLTVQVDEFQTTYDESSQSMDIVIPIREGPKTVIGTIDIRGVRSVSRDELSAALHIRSGDPYNEVDLSDARYRILEFYTTKGFPSVSVSIERSFVDHEANVAFVIDEGPFVEFGKTIVTGNTRTRYEVIKRQLLTEEGAPFDSSLLRKEKQELYRLGLFTDVNVEVLEGYDDRRDILINLNEGKAGAVEFGFGYSDYERYRGFLDVSYRNLWGMHRQAAVRTELSSLRQRLILQYYEPWFLDSGTAFRGLFLAEYREEQNIDTRETRYRLSRNAVSAGIERKLSSTVKGEFAYEFSVVNTYDVKPDVILSREDTGTLLISGLRLGLIYDTRDDPFDPKSGVLSGISAKLTSPLFLSESDFMKLSVYGNLYYQLMRRVVFAASLRGGIAKGYGATAELPIVERFFIGGRTTVRGYAQDTLGPKGSDGNPTGGNAFLMENVELRFSLGRGIGVVTFLDGGNVWVEVDDANPADTKFTTGLGFRYDTPVGPLRVDYGYKLDRERGESRGEIHFSIGHAF